MDLYYLEKTRLDFLEDHSYSASVGTLDPKDQGELLFSDGTMNSTIPEFSGQLDDVWVDVESYDDYSTRSPVSKCATNTTDLHVSPEPETESVPTPGLLRSGWICAENSVQRKLVRLLEKCVLQESIENNCSTNLSEFACFHRRQSCKHLRTRRIARFIRNAFASLSWCLESCFALHKWCLCRLPPHCLRLYCDGYARLWHQNKVTTLLSILNKTLLSRESTSQWPPDSPVHELLHLVSSGPPGNKLQSLVQTTLSARPGLHSSSILARRPNVVELSPDQPVLACLTFPASSNSSRLCSILHDLGNIGRVSVETPEEQACDMMRLRLRLYIRRVLTLLEEPKQCPVYLVGFGVGSILVLLAVLHLYSLELRRERRGLAGIICFGIPLMGLKGPRGCVNDPLLALPDVPTLFIVGSNSRLGGRKHALYFRRQLWLAQRRIHTSSSTPDLADDDQTCDSTSSDSTRPSKSNYTGSGVRKGPGIQVLTIGGADHLLRMRPSTCVRWCTTQAAVDQRVLASVERFVHCAERTSQVYSNDSNGQVSQYEHSRGQPGQLGSLKASRNLSPQLFPLSSAGVYHADGVSSHPHLSQTRKLPSFHRRPYMGSNFAGQHID
ncbi:KAT8 regulatory NSL complex subunit 3 [Clonorchis sinensis]|uniref:KAT8 regulatory NSL complex subunit 3 n=1 Tax=Clonorchis sinensis TaxID=79923 RepID=A0A8T1MTU2_CLOSI|nr:KAT8 regulatory NSL complex subunit 3 [Clonorchis sinensis]